jgi:amino acid permease
LQILPCRASLSHLITLPETVLKHVLLTTFLLLLTFLIALNVHQLELVLGIIGSTGSTTISFILPALFYLKLSPKSEFPGARGLAKALMSVGFVIMVVCLAINIYHAINGR